MQDIWTIRYRPSLPDEIPGNRLSVETLKSLAASGSLPHMIFHGPENAGKTTAALALAESLYGDSKDLNFTYLNASDFFEQGKSYLAVDKRFHRLLGTDDPSRISKSVIAVFKDVLNEYAALAPIDAPFKIIYIDDADALIDDAQNALRRIMEKYSGTCRFIFSVRNSTSLIAPLRSRCVVLFFSYLCEEDMEDFIRMIAEKEGLKISDENAEKIANASGGCISTALEIMQLSAFDAAGNDSKSENTSDNTSDNASNVSDSVSETVITGELIEANFRAADPAIAEFTSAVMEKKNILSVRSLLDKLLFDIGMTGREILLQVSDIIRCSDISEDKKALSAMIIADADNRLTQASNERIVLELFITDMENAL